MKFLIFVASVISSVSSFQFIKNTGHRPYENDGYMDNSRYNNDYRTTQSSLYPRLPFMNNGQNRPFAYPVNVNSNYPPHNDYSQHPTYNHQMNPTDNRGYRGVIYPPNYNTNNSRQSPTNNYDSYNRRFNNNSSRYPFNDYRNPPYSPSWNNTYNRNNNPYTKGSYNDPPRYPNNNGYNPSYDNRFNTTSYDRSRYPLPNNYSTGYNRGSSAYPNQGQFNPYGGYGTFNNQLGHPNKSSEIRYNGQSNYY